MTYLPTEYWNQISEMPTMKYCILKNICSLSDDKLVEFIDNVYKGLSANNYSHKAISSFIDVMPLLMEYRAINSFINKNKDYAVELRNMLPEVLSVDEAVSLMEQDKMLNNLQKNELREMLENEWDRFIIAIYEEEYINL